MNASKPLPQSVASLVNGINLADMHPGLRLDKYCDPTDMQRQKQELEDVCQTSGDEALLQKLLKRLNAALEALDALRWNGKTTGPLTLHLARSGALENAGICLHPVYGFTFLPGTGLKGLARAWAMIAWLPEQADQEEAKELLTAVFGHETANRQEEKHRAGSIVFHDAWPLAWPKLTVDIVNNHHPQYYQGDEEPGDWENPIPVSFLAVRPGALFSFALSRRHSGVPDEHLQQARTWLTEALSHLGAGAKSNAGYGSIVPVEGPEPKLNKKAFVRHEQSVELITPAYAAGARQQAEDCEFRPATVRGILRWWWRTLHAAHVDLETLRKLETTVWGDVNNGGPVRLEVKPLESPHVSESPFKVVSRNYQGKERLDWDRSFAQRHSLPDFGKVTAQPLVYLSYGMDEVSKGQRRQRFLLGPGAHWQIRLTARDGLYEKSPIPADTLLRQTRAALDLFLAFGGFGSRARKGFGSLSGGTGKPDLVALSAEAARFRNACGVTARPARPVQTPAIEEILMAEVNTPWSDPYFALHCLGYVYEQFAGSHANSERKLALGLPRQIFGPSREPLKTQDRSKHRPPKFLRCEVGDRYTSPVHFHFDRSDDGALLVRFTAFPAVHLPDKNRSKDFLEEFREHFEAEMAHLARTHKESGKAAGLSHGPRPQSAPPVKAEGPFTAGQTVTGVLLSEKTKKGKWKVDVGGHIGHINDEPSALAGLEAGDGVELVVKIAHPLNSLQFKYIRTLSK